MLTCEQIEAATGLFQQMNERKLDVPPAVFTMFGLLLGAVKGEKLESEQLSTTVDLVIRLQVKDSPTEVAKYRAALECLAEIMVVQAEDGLWSLGHAEAETEDGPSKLVANIESARVQAVLIEGRDELTKEVSP
jgi:hypothetical protein